MSLALGSTFPISIVWGSGHVQIYNDGYWPICGAKHPTSMGQGSGNDATGTFALSGRTHPVIDDRQHAGHEDGSSK